MEERMSAKSYISNKCGEGTKIDADVAKGFQELSTSLGNYPNAQDIYDLMNDKNSSQTDSNGLNQNKIVERIALEEMFSTAEETKNVEQNSGKSR